MSSWNIWFVKIFTLKYSSQKCVFAQLLSFPCSAICFSMLGALLSLLSSLYSLLSSREERSREYRELRKEYKELSMGKKRAAYRKQKSWARNKHISISSLMWQLFWFFLINWFCVPQTWPSPWARYSPSSRSQLPAVAVPHPTQSPGTHHPTTTSYLTQTLLVVGSTRST